MLEQLKKVGNLEEDTTALDWQKTEALTVDMGKLGPAPEKWEDHSDYSPEFGMMGTEKSYDLAVEAENLLGMSCKDLAAGCWWSNSDETAADLRSYSVDTAGHLDGPFLLAAGKMKMVGPAAGWQTSFDSGEFHTAAVVPLLAEYSSPLAGVGVVVVMLGTVLPVDLGQN